MCKITKLQPARIAYQRVVLGASGPPEGGGTTERSVAGGVPLGKDISEYVLTSSVLIEEPFAAILFWKHC